MTKRERKVRDFQRKMFDFLSGQKYNVENYNIFKKEKEKTSCTHKIYLHPKKTPSASKATLATAHADSTGQQGESWASLFPQYLRASAKDATQNESKEKTAKTYTTAQERDGQVCEAFFRDGFHHTGWQQRPRAGTAVAPGSLVWATCKADLVPGHGTLDSTPSCPQHSGTRNSTLLRLESRGRKRHPCPGAL